MAHFAIMDSNNIVTNVVTVDNVKVEDENGNDVEQKGIDHLKKIFQDENLNAVQCSIWTRNGERVEVNLHKPPFRNNYPCVGATWDPVTENFVMPQPYASWILNASQNWVPPVTKPTLEQSYYGAAESPPEVQETDYVTIDNVLILPDRLNPIWNEADQKWQGLHNDGVIRSWDSETLTWSPSI